MVKVADRILGKIYSYFYRDESIVLYLQDSEVKEVGEFVQIWPIYERRGKVIAPWDQISLIKPHSFKSIPEVKKEIIRRLWSDKW